MTKRFHLRSWRAKLAWIAILVGLIALRLHFENPDAVATRKTLDDLLGALSQDRITYLTDQSWCKLLATSNVAYMKSSSDSGGSCRPPDATTISFDRHGEELFRAAHRAIGASRLDLVMLAVRYGADGVVTSADFGVENHFGHSWYAYTPHRPLLSFHKGTVTQIGGGWVFIETD